MAKKQGYEKGFGKYSTPVKLNEGPKLQDTDKGKDLSKQIYDNNDSAAIRGTREGFS